MYIRGYMRSKKQHPTNTDRVRLAIVCTANERKLIKMFASYEDKTLNDFVMECVRARLEQCDKSHEPNIETKKALLASERGEGLQSHNSIDDMFDFLGI